MPKISSFSIYTHINGFLNAQLPALAHRKNRYPHLLFDAGDFFKGATATIAGEFSIYEEDRYTGETVSSIQVIVDCVVDLDNGVSVIYGAVETNRGIEKGYFHMNCVTALDTTTAKAPYKSVVKCMSQLRREMRKADNKFPYAMFTPGTRCIVEVGDEVTEITVKSLSQDGPDHFCIDTGIPIGMESEIMKDMTHMYHIGYVTQVLEHKPVPLVIDPYRGHEIEGSNIHKNIRAEMARKNGRSNRYSGSCWDIIRHAVNDLPLRVGQVYDVERLTGILYMQGIIQQVNTKTTDAEGWYANWVFTANKKKVKRAVRRLQGKISGNARKKQEEEDERMNREMAAMEW